MKDPFLEQQWQELNQRLQQCASHIAAGDDALAARFAEQAAAFASNPPPQRYSYFLDRVREAAGLAIQWQQTRSAQTAGSRTAAEQGELGSKRSNPANENMAWAGSAA